MIVQIAAMFGHSITKETAASALGAGVLGNIAGTAVFEGLNLGYPFTIPAKIIAATAVMEALGLAAYEVYENGGSF